MCLQTLTKPWTCHAVPHLSNSTVWILSDMAVHLMMSFCSLLVSTNSSGRNVCPALWHAHFYEAMLGLPVECLVEDVSPWTTFKPSRVWPRGRGKVINKAHCPASRTPLIIIIITKYSKSNQTINSSKTQLPRSKCSPLLFLLYSPTASWPPPLPILLRLPRVTAPISLPSLTVPSKLIRVCYAEQYRFDEPVEC